MTSPSPGQVFDPCPVWEIWPLPSPSTQTASQLAGTSTPELPLPGQLCKQKHQRSPPSFPRELQQSTSLSSQKESSLSTPRGVTCHGEIDEGAIDLFDANIPGSSFWLHHFTSFNANLQAAAVLAALAAGKDKNFWKQHFLYLPREAIDWVDSFVAPMTIDEDEEAKIAESISTLQAELTLFKGKGKHATHISLVSTIIDDISSQFSDKSRFPIQVEIHSSHP